MPQKLRDDLEELKATVARMGGSGLQATTFVGRTDVETTYPSSAGRYYLVTPMTMAGDETEGSPWSGTPRSDQGVLAANLGSAVPPLGSTVLVFSVPNRWVFFYG